ncbi:amidase family protein [Aquisalibacillus elongatus]|uniref:Amidase n=1 Tax=Aquisalibacillus elongatus TaxID=485577 RepID=A0A3N5B088_9BACI|nr:amidase family protein [Aquisalibacillus elongatus]RPF50633.1 amidase [Aquisalibacillus elongatus]
MDFLNEPIDVIQKRMQDGELTSRELVLTYLDRIANYDQDGPKINSVAEVNPDAIFIAETLDQERMEKGARGPLHGIPIVLKDNIDTGDKTHTTAGSLALKDHVAKHDAFLVKQLREAGAVILGKANLTEWANFMTEGMPNGYSSRGGQVLNPYGPGEIDTGGSSSGPGAAVAANFATVSVGSETSGSILSPASQHALVGIKPTVGAISRSGVIPISHTQDTAGPLAKTVADAVYVFQAMVGEDAADAATSKGRQFFRQNFSQYLNKKGLKGKRIGIAREDYFDAIDEEKRQLMDEAIQVLEEQGAEVLDVTIPSNKRNWGLGVMVYEFKNSLNAYLRSVSDDVPVRSMADVIEFNNKYDEDMLPYGQKWFLEAEKTSGLLTDPDYLKELLDDQYYSKEQGIDYTLEEHQLDAIVFPNNIGAAIPAKAGYPSITVTAGLTEKGEPVGITFTGTAFSEPTLIEVAFGYEQASFKRVSPMF